MLPAPDALATIRAWAPEIVQGDDVLFVTCPNVYPHESDRARNARNIGDLAMWFNGDASPLVLHREEMAWQLGRERSIGIPPQDARGGLAGIVHAILMKEAERVMADPDSFAAKWQAQLNAPAPAGHLWALVTRGHEGTLTTWRPKIPAAQRHT